MIEHKNTPAENVAAKEELEATLGLALDHPNIVRTFKYANRELAPTVKVTTVPTPFHQFFISSRPQPSICSADQ